MNKFNVDNKGHITKDYPLFMGEDLGVLDTVNIAYPQLEELYQLQLSQIWNEFEVDLTQDKIDMMSLPKDTVDLMKKTIMWQHLADSVASRSIIEILGEYISNSELHGLATLWSFFEVIHARTYSHIVKQTFVDPNEMLEEIYKEMGVLQRSEVIVETFNALANLGDYVNEHEQRRMICRTMVALFALEAIAFMSSFAVTFAITETDVFQGIGKLVTLICRDEVLHTRMSAEIISILQKDPVMASVLNDLKPELKDILDEVVNQELNWAQYLFSDGRSVIGLNETLLKEYTLHMSKPIYDMLGVEYTFEVVEKNPLPYIEKYIDSSKMQAAAQEIQISSYKVGAVKDDTEGLDLDFGDDFEDYL